MHTRDGSKNLPYWDIAHQVISDLLMQAIDCLKTRLTINVSELHYVNEFWYNRLVYENYQENTNE
jgi:hypothetical protein